MKHTVYNGTIYSYVMNNYWQTNYKADQPGKTLFRYVFKPHGEFSPAENYRLAMENVQPVVVSFGGKQVRGSPIRSSHPDVVVSSLGTSEDKIILRLVNVSEKEVETALTLNGTEVDIQVVSAGKQGILVGKRVRLMKFETALVEIDDRR